MTNDASSLPRKATAAATSAGVPGRPTGVCEPDSSSSGAELPVAIQPGATQLTVTPDGPVSSANVRARPSSPALAAA